MTYYNPAGLPTTPNLAGDGKGFLCLGQRVKPSSCSPFSSRQLCARTSGPPPVRPPAKVVPSFPRESTLCWAMGPEVTVQTWELTLFTLRRPLLVKINARTTFYFRNWPISLLTTHKPIYLMTRNLPGIGPYSPFQKLSPGHRPELRVLCPCGTQLNSWHSQCCTHGHVRICSLCTVLRTSRTSTRLPYLDLSPLWWWESEGLSQNGSFYFQHLSITDQWEKCANSQSPGKTTRPWKERKLQLAWLGGLGWLEHCPVGQKAGGSIPNQGMYRRKPVDVSLPLLLPLSL